MSTENLITQYKGKLLTIKNLPTLPLALIEMNRMIDNPTISNDQIAGLISKDQVLSAKVLKMVNSPIYGFPGRISSIKHALVLLGFNVVRGILLSTTIFESLPAGMTRLWDHSIATSLVCAELARILKIKEPGEFAVAGLLHDIGKVIIAVQLPDANKEINKRIKTEDITIREAEEQVLGFKHDKVNGWLSSAWGLPPILHEGITYHHNPELALTYPEVAACVQLSDFLVRIFQQGYGGDDQAPEISQQTFKILGANQQVLGQVLGEVTKKFGTEQSQKNLLEKSKFKI